MKAIFILFALLLNGSIYLAHSAEAVTAVELRSQGKRLELSASADKPLIEQALKLVATSNFHSGPGDKYHFFTLHEVQKRYRDTVAGRFLVIVLETPRKIATFGGESTVSEIIIGLNRDDYASSLFTIDDSGRVVGHAKYSGERCIEILKTVKQFSRGI